MPGPNDIVDNRYYVTSNRESGDGRYDLQLEPKDGALPGILIELKAAKNVSEDELKTLAQTALRQIETQKYGTDMKTHGVKSILKYGVAFSGKQMGIVRE